MRFDCGASSRFASHFRPHIFTIVTHDEARRIAANVAKLPDLKCFSGGLRPGANCSEGDIMYDESKHISVRGCATIATVNAGRSLFQWRQYLSASLMC